MSGLYYRDFGASGTGLSDEAMARLRTDQLLRAVRVATGIGAPSAVRRVSGQVMADDEPGGEGARVIDAISAATWNDLRPPPHDPGRGGKR